MIQVAVVIEALGRGGAERLLIDTARFINRERFAFRVFTLFEARRDYADALRELGVPETCLAIAGPKHIRSGIRRLRALLRKDRADLVHTHLFTANVIGRTVARLEGIPVVSSYHDADYEPVVRLGNPRLTRPKHTVLKMIDLFTLWASDAHSLAVSDYVALSVRRRLRLPAHRVSTIPNAVDTMVFCPDPARRAEKRRSLGVRGDEPVILCVGRMTPQKGQETLVRALALAQLPLGHLWLAGDGPQRPKLEETARDLAPALRVAFLGTRPDVPDLLRAADVLVLPSLHEGFGLVVAEALASGTAIVASKVGPLPEIVRHGETGLLVTPGDPRALADAVGQLASQVHRRCAMGVRGREDATARFAMPLMVTRLEALYGRLACAPTSSDRATLPAR